MAIEQVFVEESRVLSDELGEAGRRAAAPMELDELHPRPRNRVVVALRRAVGRRYLPKRGLHRQPCCQGVPAGKVRPGQLQVLRVSETVPCLANLVQRIQI